MKTKVRMNPKKHTQACAQPLPCSYLSRYFSEKSTIVWNMGAGMYAGSLGACGNLTACKRVSGVSLLGVQGFFVWQSHSSNPWEALLELYIVLGVWRRRTLGSPNHHAVFREDRFLPRGPGWVFLVLWVSKLRWHLFLFFRKGSDRWLIICSSTQDNNLWENSL